MGVLAIFLGAIAHPSTHPAPPLVESDTFSSSITTILTWSIQLSDRDSQLIAAFKQRGRDCVKKV